MKRRAPFADDGPQIGSSDESNGSNSAYEDIEGHSRKVTLQYGVTWELFTQGNSRDDRVQAFRKVREVLQPSLTNAAVSASALHCQATVAKWYLGVTFCPAHRWGEEPSPHKRKWDILHVLLLGRDMGRYEKNFLRVLCHIPECKARCANVGAGGERCPRSSIKFLYLCVKYTAPPGGGWKQCLEVNVAAATRGGGSKRLHLAAAPLDDGEAELGDSERELDRVEALAPSRELDREDWPELDRADRVEALAPSRSEQEEALLLPLRSRPSGGIGPSATMQIAHAREALGRCGPERDRAAASACGSHGTGPMPCSSQGTGIPSQNVHLRAVRKALGLCRSEQEARDSEGEEARE